MQLKYSLSRYDEAGRLKPPVSLYLALMFACRTLLIIIVGVTLKENTDAFLRMFYPIPGFLFLSFIPTIFAVTTLFLIGKRYVLWAHVYKYKWVCHIKLLALLALCMDAVVSFSVIYYSNFTYSWITSSSILITLTGIIYIVRSSYLQAMQNDWRLRE